MNTTAYRGRTDSKPEARPSVLLQVGIEALQSQRFARNFRRILKGGATGRAAVSRDIPTMQKAFGPGTEVFTPRGAACTGPVKEATLAFAVDVTAD
jgi:hypothetical protein